MLNEVLQQAYNICKKPPLKWKQYRTSRPFYSMNFCAQLCDFNGAYFVYLVKVERVEASQRHVGESNSEIAYEIAFTLLCFNRACL